MRRAGVAVLLLVGVFLTGCGDDKAAVQSSNDLIDRAIVAGVLHFNSMKMIDRRAVCVYWRDHQDPEYATVVIPVDVQLDMSQTQLEAAAVSVVVSVCDEPRYNR